jgi:hypothetical protein
MSRYVQVEGYSGLVRDTESNAIINTNAEEIELARERKRLAKSKREQDDLLHQKVECLESELSDIKGMLQTLINKL